MDGLTIGNSQTLLDAGATASEIRSSQFKNVTRQPELAPQIAPPALPGVKEPNFADTLKEAMGAVNNLQKQADFKAQALATGKTTDIPDVLMAAEKADIALRLMTQVRNKVIDAYQEIMKMQV